MSEIQTVNAPQLTKDVTEMKQALTKLAESMNPAPQPKGHVEEDLKSDDQVKKAARESFKEFLKSANAGDSWSFTAAAEKTGKLKEAIGAVTATSAIPSVWTAEPEILSPDQSDGYFLTSPAVQWKTDVKGKPGQVVYVPTVAPVTSGAITSGSEPSFTAATVSNVPVTLVQKGH